MEQKKYEIDMTQGSLLKNILRFSIPLMLSGILQLLYNAADIVVVGRFAGSESLAAVGSTGPVVNLIVNLFIGLSVGTAVLVARYFGSREYEKVEKTVHTSIFISLISGCIVAVLGFFISKPILSAMGTPPDVIEKSALYLKIFFLGMPATMLYNFGSAILRSVGDTKRPLYFSLFSGVINVVLNLIFVIIFKLDVAGVAIATVVAQTVSALLVLQCLIKSTGCYRLNLKKLKLHKAELAEIAKIGLPAGLQSSIFSISNVLIQSSVNGFGSVVMAGNAAAVNIEGFVYIAMNAVHHASLTVTGQNYGAGDFKRIKRGTACSIGVVSAIGLIMGFLVYLFGTPLLSIYSPSADVIKAGMVRIMIIPTTYFLCGIMDVMVGVLRGLGYSVMPMIVSLLGACGLRILWIYTVFAADKDIMVLYYSYPVSWIITAFVHLICFAFAFRKRKRERLGDALLQ